MVGIKKKDTHISKINELRDECSVWSLELERDCVLGHVRRDRFLDYVTALQQDEYLIRHQRVT